MHCIDSFHASAFWQSGNCLRPVIQRLRQKNAYAGKGWIYLRTWQLLHHYRHVCIFLYYADVVLLFCGHCFLIRNENSKSISTVDTGLSPVDPTRPQPAVKPSQFVLKRRPVFHVRLMFSG